MKKIYILLAALGITTAAKAQIPNSDFENWTTVGNYEDPDGWATLNFLSVPNGHTNCSKSTDHVFGGNYSMKVTNNTSLDQSQGGNGVVATGGIDYPFEPAFPVSENPTALTFYYKTEMFNGDSGQVVVVMFNQGSIISQHGEALPPATSWTPYVLDMDVTGTADSATIILFSYAPEGPNDVHLGNSSIWVDHLNWNTLISGVDDQEQALNSIGLYPNPTKDVLTINNLETGDVLAVYNITGAEMMDGKASSSTFQFETTSLAKGMYVLRVIRGERVGQYQFVVE
jgi:hypothetical protein